MAPYCIVGRNSGCGSATIDPDELAAVAWLKQRGHSLATSDPTSVELAPLLARFNGARVIGVGEVTHGTHEDQAFKVVLIKELVRAGAIDTLAIEANRVAGTGFNRYVRTGVGEPVALIQSPSFFGFGRAMSLRSC